MAGRQRRADRAACRRHAKTHYIDAKGKPTTEQANFRTLIRRFRQAYGDQVRKTAFRAPNTNTFVERFIQRIQQDCLDHFVNFGEGHFN